MVADVSRMDTSGEMSAPANEQFTHELPDEEKKKKKVTGSQLRRRFTGLIVTVLHRSLDCFDVALKILGPIFMLIALSLFSFETYTYFVFVLPSKSDEMPMLKASGTFLGVFLLSNLVFNYLKAICTDPGRPPEYDSESLIEDGPESVSDDGKAPQVRPKRCGKCGLQKPERAHHCSVCKRCVLKMDHHCPWINNCVGYGNYRYFCLFLFYLALCCLFVMVMYFQAFLETMVSPRRSKISFSGRQSISLCWIIATCILFALMLLGGFHVYLVLTNQTTIEFHTNMQMKDKARRRGEYFRNPYDLGRSRNFKQVFGPNDFFTFRWALSWLSQPPVGDGVNYQSTNFTKA
jgi:palmitoyltransferase